MAKELVFKLVGTDYGAAPVKLERKKIYGWTDVVATDRSGSVCGSAYLSPDDALVIPKGGLKQAVVDDSGRWVEKGELTAYSEDGQKEQPLLPSSFDAPIELKKKATADRGIRDLMFAVRRLDGLFQMFALGSTGMTDEDRADIAKRLSEKHVESQYVLSDSRGIAYQMVKPELVFEISVLELVARGNDDKIKMNPLLKFDEQQGWLMESTTPGVSVLGITIERERTDKQPNETDVRISQLTDICPFEEPDSASSATSVPSELLERHVYKKVSGEKVMLHKFLLWKTNKEQSGRYPAYIIYHTDFSSSRKELIKRDMLYSNDEQQIRDLLAAEIADNIKKGWEEVK